MIDNTATFRFRIPVELKEKLDRLAALTARDPKEIVATALKEMADHRGARDVANH